VETPAFESTDLFARGVGASTDIVMKEMYTFEDKAGRSLTLRPEGTAPVVRTYLAHRQELPNPFKAYYVVPMFRHERPQKGRQRQFHQIDVELLGVPAPQGDVEIIALGRHILEALGVAELTTLELNTLGDPDSRRAYRDALVAYFSDRRDGLSADSHERLERNPLRILDSKDEGDRAILADAPVMSESMNEASRAFFDEVRAGLEAIGIAYVLNPRLVRGLDYYTHTAFEFTTTELGAQGAHLGGGPQSAQPDHPRVGRLLPGGGVQRNLPVAGRLREARPGGARRRYHSCADRDQNA
jgi:histidyl-tRNA synthetase